MLSRLLLLLTLGCASQRSTSATHEGTSGDEVASSDAVASEQSDHTDAGDPADDTDALGSLHGPGDRRPEMAPGDAIVRSSLPREVIQAVIRENNARVRYCYERRLQAEPELEGELQVRFVIGPDGTVQSAQAVSGFDTEVDRCVVASMRELRFPPPDGGGIVVVNYPFNFRHGS